MLEYTRCSDPSGSYDSLDKAESVCLQEEGCQGVQYYDGDYRVCSISEYYFVWGDSTAYNKRTGNFSNMIYLIILIYNLI